MILLILGGVFMYIEFNNPNDVVRDWIVGAFNGMDISDDNIIDEIINIFNQLREDSIDSYQLVLSIMYQDYFIDSNCKGKAYKSINDFYDLEQQTEEDYIFLLDLLVSVFSFYNKDFLDKKYSLLKCSDYTEYLKSINLYYSLDIFKYCRDFTKEDLLYWYYENYNNCCEEDERDKEFIALDNVSDLLYGLYAKDRKCYFSLIKEVMEEGYYYIKNESSPNILEEYGYELITKLENTNFKKLSNVILDDDLFLSDVLYCFIEYNKKNKQEQMNLKQKTKKLFID